MPAARPALRVLVADDSAVGTALVAAIDADPELACVARVADPVRVAAVAAEVQPDLVLLALLLDGSTTIQSVPLIRARVPGVRVLLLSEVSSDILAAESLRRGAAGFLVHDGNVAHLLERVRACGGRTLLDEAAEPEPDRWSAAV
jgi:two-component system response regulator DesR